jgi:hypothetical protein
MGQELKEWRGNPSWTATPEDIAYFTSWRPKHNSCCWCAATETVPLTRPEALKDSNRQAEVRLWHETDQRGRCVNVR